MPGGHWSPAGMVVDLARAQLDEGVPIVATLTGGNDYVIHVIVD